MYTYFGKLVRVIDGDTIVVDIDLGFDLIIKQTIRLDGIDAPETNSKDLTEKKMGIRAKEELNKLLYYGKELLTLETIKTNDKYGRYLARVFVKGEDVAEKLLASKFVYPYDGKTKVGNLSDLAPLVDF